MAQVKINIEKINTIIHCIVVLGSEKLPFVFEFNKTLKSLRKVVKEFEDDLVKLRESFYEEIKPPKVAKNTPEGKVFKKYLFKKDGKSWKPLRDETGKMIVYKDGDKLDSGVQAYPSVGDENLEDFTKEYKKLIEHLYTVDVHQIQEDRFYEALDERFKIKGEAVDSNIVSELEGFLIVEEIEQ